MMIALNYLLLLLLILHANADTYSLHLDVVSTQDGAAAAVTPTLMSSLFSIIGNETDTSLNCFDDNLCFAKFSTDKISFQVSTSLEEDGNIIHVDVLATSSIRDFARNSLVLMVSSPDVPPDSFWTIRKRGSRLTKDNAEWEVSTSIESLVLSNPDAFSKKSLLNLTTNLEDYTGSDIDVWEYMLNGKEQMTRSIFYNSQLRATSDPIATAFTEAFVHPALMSHEDPGVIALFSDAPLLFLKEILKYKSIEKVYLLGTNKRLLEAMILYLPELNNCSDIIDIGSSCIQSSLLEFVEGDLEEWCEHFQDSIDVVFIDAAMSRQKSFWLSDKFYDVVSMITDEEEGVVVLNVGSAPLFGRQYSHGTDDHDRDTFFSLSDSMGSKNFWSVYAYDEPSAVPMPSAFALLFRYEKSMSYKRFIRSSPSAFDLDIIERFRVMNHPIPTALYDGPTHQTYTKPSRAWEDWYCQSNVGSKLPICQSFIHDFYNPDNHVDHTTIVKRDPVKGRGLYAAKSIKKGTWINADDTALQLSIDGFKWSALQDFIAEYPDATMYKDLSNWMIAYGFENENTGNSGWSASIGNINTFTNHACDKKSENVGVVDLGWSIFNLGIARRSYIDSITVAYRNIVEGEEIQMNYIVFRTELEDDQAPEEFKAFLDSICSTKKGLVDVTYSNQENSEL